MGSAADATRLFAMSIGDLLREWFETDAVQAMLAVNGVIGTWAGPEAPGTAYVMLHHSIGDVGTGNVGAWGYPEGGMGAVSESIRRAAESFGAVVRTDAPVERILTSGGRVTGVALRSGEELAAPIVVAATHPQLTFLRQLDPGVLPDDFLARMRHWRSRSGTVKVNLALSELPDFVADPGTGLQPHHTGAIELAHSLEYLETAFQEARSGQPATRPFSDGCIPSTFDRTICPEGTHIMSLFTQWVPAEWAAEPHQEELEAYADRVVDAYTELAPNLKRSIIHRQVIGPHEMEDTYGLIGGLHPHLRRRGSRYGRPPLRSARRSTTPSTPRPASRCGTSRSSWRPSREDAAPAAAERLPEPLSERELEVLALVAAGMSNKEIAGRLFVSVTTVKTHINNLYRRLDARSRIQTVACARELGIL